MPDLLSIVLVVIRALSFIAVFQAAGAALFLFLFADCAARSVSAVRSLGVSAAIVSMVLITARYLLGPAMMAGDVSGIFDSTLHEILLESDVSTAQMIRLLGVIVIAVTLNTESRVGEGLGIIGATLIAVSFTFMGHTASNDERWLLSGLLFVHLLSVAFWFGALLPLYLSCNLERAAVLGSLISRFSIIAARTVPLIFLAGIGMSILLLPAFRSLGTPYGISLLGKILAFTALMSLAALNKYRLGPAVSVGDPRALRLFQYSVATKIAVMLAIFSVTALMTTLFSPDH